MILVTHDDVIKCKRFPRYWPFVRGIHRSPVSSPHKGQWRGTLMFSLICARIHDWVNNREAGDLRRRRAHYDVTVVIHYLHLPYRHNGACHAGGHYWYYYVAVLFLNQVTATHLNIGHPSMKSSSVQTSNEWQMLDNVTQYRDRIPSSCCRATDPIVPFHKDFPPSGEQPEQHELAHMLYQLTDGCTAIFHKYYCFTKHGGIKTNLTLRNLWRHITDICQNTTMRVNGAWIKIYCVLCSKPYNTLHSCHNFPAG